MMGTLLPIRTEPVSAILAGTGLSLTLGDLVGCSPSGQLAIPIQSIHAEDRLGLFDHCRMGLRQPAVDAFKRV